MRKECQLCGNAASEIAKIKNKHNGNILEICEVCMKEFGFKRGYTVEQVAFYFEISEKAKLAENENGKYTPCYCKVEIDFCKSEDDAVFSKEYEKQAKKFIKGLAEQFKISEVDITNISKEEYLIKADDD